METRWRKRKVLDVEKSLLSDIRVGAVCGCCVCCCVLLCVVVCWGCQCGLLVVDSALSKSDSRSTKKRTKPQGPRYVH